MIGSDMHINKFYAILITFVLFLGGGRLCVDAYAQEFVNFEHYNIENGLSQNTINCTIQDSCGFMWFGTKDGLNRFDGNQFKIYKHVSQDSTSLGSNNILSLCLD